MGRLHLFEFEDLSWCPRVIREVTTDFLLGIYNVFHIYEPAFDKIIELIKKTGFNTIIDCCSGSTGPIGHLREHLNKSGNSSVKIHLTDKYPNIHAFSQLEKKYPDQLISHYDTLEANNLPSNLQGIRTFFSAFHHFKPEEAKKILQNAVDNQMPIAIFESTQRYYIDFIRALFSPILILFILPFSKRLAWKKFLFTYLIPITPWTNLWDYIVSNLRTYSLKEMQALIDQLDAPGYCFEIGKMWSKRARCNVPYLIGYKI